MARVARTEPRHRMYIDLPEAVCQQVEELRKQVHADTLSEVMRRALALYELMIAERAKGFETVLRDNSGKEKQLQFM